MPKKTFLNLDDSKKKRITDAFLREFAVKSFDEASLSVVVKELKIAKGSMYQYFEDKLDLYLYLIGQCSSLKKKYNIERKNYPDFWVYFRTLYEYGFKFDNEHALQSHFLFNLLENLNSPTIKHIYGNILEQSVLAFEEMVRNEVTLGLFRSDIPIETMGFMLYKTGVSIQENLIFSKVIEPKKSIVKNMPVYSGKKTELMKTVDDYIRLIKPSFDKK